MAMKPDERRKRLAVLQRVRRKVEALSALGLITESEWLAFNGLFSDELTAVMSTPPAKGAKKP